MPVPVPVPVAVPPKSSVDRTARILGAVLAAVGALAGVVVLAMIVRHRASGPTLGPGEGVVVEVIDGDTVEVRLADGEERVRLLGVDTPETVDPSRPPECFGAEASARTRELLPTGTVVVLERDLEARDHYGRLLAFVFRRSDHLMINRALLAEGLATPLAIAPNLAYRAELASVAAEARRAGRGLWSACARDPPG
ncbi:MAG: thermonuclease family protein [Acidimicrobiales bacterium]